MTSRLATRIAFAAHPRLQIYECEIHFIYAADAGRHLDLEDVHETLAAARRWSDSCDLEFATFDQIYGYFDPLLAEVREKPLVLMLSGTLNNVPIGNAEDNRVPYRVRIMFHEIGFVTTRLSLFLSDVVLDCRQVARAEMLNEVSMNISCPRLGALISTPDEYVWDLFAAIEQDLQLAPRVPSGRKGELERVLVLRRVRDDPTAQHLLNRRSRDLAAMIARLQWYQDQSLQLAHEMVKDPLVLHKYLMILCKWTGKLIYYPNRLPADVREIWSDGQLLNFFELLMVQFFALRLYNVILESSRADVQRAITALSTSDGELVEEQARRDAVKSLLRVETVRAEIELSVHETQNSLVSLTYVMGELIERYDKTIRLKDRLAVVYRKLEDLARLNDVVVATLTQQTNEALLSASLDLQKETANQGKTLKKLNLLLVVLTVVLVALGLLAIDVFRDPFLRWLNE